MCRLSTPSDTGSHCTCGLPQPIKREPELQLEPEPEGVGRGAGVGHSEQRASAEQK
jgi:hypothetical protein